MDDVIAYFQGVFEARQNFRQPKEGSVVVGEWWARRTCLCRSLSPPNTTPKARPFPACPPPGFKEARCLDVATPDDCLPERATCPMPYHRDAGIDHDDHSGNAGCKFYVVCPSRTQGTFNLETAQVRGYRNSRSLTVHHWEDAEEAWALCCLHWHGPACPNILLRITMNTRVHLNPASRRIPMCELKWAMRGLEETFGSRVEATTAAAARDMREIHILGSLDEGVLDAWRD
ncbi:hypothetical protein B0H13DRAFT_1919663 [Mycena leptocephala]|nr:hypothetical protein B0H13DRAFT_1919663 [Mycena leptocephala]